MQISTQRNVLILFAFCAFTFPTIAEPLIIAFDFAKPPYIYKKEKSGFEIELVKQVFNEMGYETQFKSLTVMHHDKLIESNTVDALMTVNTSVVHNANLLSKSYVNYQNVAISLAKSQIKINSIDELKKYSVVAFKSASRLLGDEFHAITKVHDQYFEVEHQLKQVSLLYSGKVDVIIIDLNIFNYYRNEAMIPTISSLDYHEIFPITEYQLAFNNQTLVTKFDTTLAKFKYSEKYKILKEKYHIKQSL